MTVRDGKRRAIAGRKNFYRTLRDRMRKKGVRRSSEGEGVRKYARNERRVRE